MAKARQIAHILDEENIYEPSDDDDDDKAVSDTVALRVDVRQSPYIDTFYKHHPVRLILERDMV